MTETANLYSALQLQRDCLEIEKAKLLFENMA